MKRLALALLLLTGAAHAADAPPPPPQWPITPDCNLHYGDIPPETANPDASMWAAWKCDGMTTPAIYAFTKLEVAKFAFDFVTLGVFDKAAADAAFVAAPQTEMTPALDIFLHRKAVFYGWTLARTLNTIAYKRSIGGTADAPVITYTRVGTLPLATPCVMVDDNYCMVPQSAVKRDVPSVALPLPVYGFGG